MKTAALVSGGKDSIYALYKAQEKHDVEVIIAIKSKNPHSYMFHRPNIDLVKLQAKSLGIPLIFQETLGEKEKELKDLKKAIRKAKKEYKIKGVISGAIASKYQRKRIEKICKELNLEGITPLWNINPEKYMKALLSKFEVMITKVSGMGLTKDLLGKKINLEEIKKLSEKYRFHLAFEGGEAETLVLDGLNFSEKIEILDSEIKWNNKDKTGELIITEAELK